MHSASDRGRSFSIRFFAAFLRAGSPAYCEAMESSLIMAYRSQPSVWYSIRFSISVNSIKSLLVFSIKKSHSIILWLKNGNKKSLTVKVLFTIRRIQPEYEKQRDSGSFFKTYESNHIYIVIFFTSLFDHLSLVSTILFNSILKI